MRQLIFLRLLLVSMCVQPESCGAEVVHRTGQQPSEHAASGTHQGCTPAASVQWSSLLVQVGISRLNMLGAVAGNDDGQRRVEAQLQNVGSTISHAVTIMDAYIAGELQHCLRTRRLGMQSYAQGLQSTCGIWSLLEPGTP